MTLHSRTAEHLLAAACSLCACAPPAASAETKPPAPIKPADTDDAVACVKKGRALFDQNKFPEALREFERALTKSPSDKDTRFLCGLAAYWARQPAKALAYWNQLADQTPRGGNSEWNVVRHRIMALSATGNSGAADMAAERLRELRAAGKISAAANALGFVREHFFLDDVRAGCWEAFDDHGEAPALWTFTVARTASGKQPGDAIVATLAVERAPLPGGGAGFIFSEETQEKGRDVRRLYKRWSSRPQYDEVRELALNVIKGSIPVIEEKSLKTAPEASASESAAAALVPPHIKAMGLDPQAEGIVAAAWSLREVKTDVTRLARIPAEDPAALTEFMNEFGAHYPHAARDASELTEKVLNAKAPGLLSACGCIVRMDARGSYLEFAVLTALNTRGRDMPPALLENFSASRDFMVRQTANMLLARMGDKNGLERLLDETQQADARGCELRNAAFIELLGSQLEAPPGAAVENAAEKLTAWKLKIAAWRTENLAKLSYQGGAKEQNGAALWVVK